MPRRRSIRSMSCRIRDVACSPSLHSHCSIPPYRTPRPLFLSYFSHDRQHLLDVTAADRCSCKMILPSLQMHLLLPTDDVDSFPIKRDSCFHKDSLPVAAAAVSWPWLERRHDPCTTGVDTYPDVDNNADKSSDATLLAAPPLLQPLGTALLAKAQAIC